jgi:predicted RNase H-like HicB family nuclease
MPAMVGNVQTVYDAGKDALQKSRVGQIDSGRLSWFQRGPHRHLPCYPESSGYPADLDQLGEFLMIDLPYSLVIEATAEPDYFGFYSPELEGFSGVGHSVEDCLYRAKWGMREHLDLLKEQGLTVPPRNPNPTVTIQNEQRVPIA